MERRKNERREIIKQLLAHILAVFNKGITAKNIFKIDFEVQHKN